MRDEASESARHPSTICAPSGVPFRDLGRGRTNPRGCTDSARTHVSGAPSREHTRAANERDRPATVATCDSAWLPLHCGRCRTNPRTHAIGRGNTPTKAATCDNAWSPLCCPKMARARGVKWQCARNTSGTSNSQCPYPAKGGNLRSGLICDNVWSQGVTRLVNLVTDLFDLAKLAHQEIDIVALRRRDLLELGLEGPHDVHDPHVAHIAYLEPEGRARIPGGTWPGTPSPRTEGLGWPCRSS